MGNGKRQILIEIPEEFMRDWEASRFSDCIKRVRSDFNHIASPYRMAGKYEIETLDMLQIAFKNGILLPKGHGDLVDVKAYLKDVCGWFDSDDCCDHDCKNCEFVTRIAELFEHIVINADKEGQDGKQEN